MLNVLPDSLFATIAIFLACAGVIGVSGTRLSAVADQLADRAGLGEALMGGVLLGAVTSISGSVLSVSAAWNGAPELALSNAFGGMAAQMAFLAIADMALRKVNLEHAAASLENIFQCALLVLVLSIVMMAAYSPEWTLWGIHPGTPIVIGVYLYGVYLINKFKGRPMWRPVRTPDTVTDVPDENARFLNLSHLWARFVFYATLMGLAGWILEGTATRLIDITGVEAVVVGALMTSVATSLPELVTSVAAVRRGALTLAVSALIGGNAYDALFAAFSDIAYRDGSIYHQLDDRLFFWITLNLAMGGLLAMGLLARERRGVANIGFESMGILFLYALGVLILFV